MKACRTRSRSPEREDESLRSRVEEFDLESPIADDLRFPDQLIQPLFCQPAHALAIDIGAARVPRWLSIERNAKADGRPGHGRSHDQMEIASVEPIRDAPVRSVQAGRLLSDRPVARERPLIES